MTLDQLYSENHLFSGAITSLVVILIFLVLRFLGVRFIKGKKKILHKEQRRWINRINNAFTIFILIALMLIWTPQLQTFALSLTAVAVAIVLTIKELLMCLTGGLLRASSKSFEIGDWVTIDDEMGEVIKITPTTTLIEKIDHESKSYDFTGETVQIPNSRFLTTSVTNANFIKDFIFYDVRIVVPFTDLNPQNLTEHLRGIMQAQYAPHAEKAEALIRRVEQKSSFDFAEPDPKLYMTVTDLGHYIFTARLFVPTGKAIEIGSAITEEFLAYVYTQRQALKAKQEQESQNKDEVSV